MRKYKNGAEHMRLAKCVTPGGAQTLSKMPARFPEGAFPSFLTSGARATVCDMDANTYIDWIGALGACPLGYNHTRFTNRVMEAFLMAGGTSFSLPHPSELRLAERLCSVIPCAEMVRFVNSGSEATEAAIRTARIATGREMILTVKSGYHSWHSWFQAVKDWHPGVPKEYGYLVDGFTYNDIESVVYAIRSHGSSDSDHHVAAIIMEPCLFEKPQDNFLESVRALCDRYGIILIFDEMVTGYRWEIAGGQQFFGVTPDLATFGKGMANGFPIGMLCGKEQYMRHAELISGTFGGNVASMAAAGETLTIYQTDHVITTMWKRGVELQTHFNALASEHQVLSVCDGYPCKPRIKFTYHESTANEKAMSLFLQVAAEHRVLFHPGGLNVCYALDDQDMQSTYRAITEGLKSVSWAMGNNDWAELRGSLIRPVVTVRSA